MNSLHADDSGKNTTLFIAASARARRTQRTAWPNPSAGPASTTKPISALLVDVPTCPRDHLLPRFQNRRDFVFHDIAHRNPVSPFLGADQLRQGAFQHCREFLSGNFCTLRFDPAKI